jgi:3-hydroxyisobutyrate dehydrogenase-like beta-hydroxyacid dehydrogenase
MARRLLASEIQVGFYARRPEVIDEFARLGARAHETVRDLAENTDVLLVVVVDDAQVRDVLVDQGAIEGLREGSIVVIHSTVHPDTCREMAALAAQRGIEVIDAPVTGGPQRSMDGTLTMPVGCDRPEVLQRVRPLLLNMATTVERVGRLGAGEATKLLNNFFYYAHCVTAFDTERLVDLLELDRNVAAEILPTCSGSSDVLRQRATAEIPWRPLDHAKGLEYAGTVMRKDVRLFIELARSRGIDMERDFSESIQMVNASIARGLPPGTPHPQSVIP